MKFSMFSAFFQGLFALTNFFIISHAFELVNNFFQLFFEAFFCPFPCEPSPRFTLFFVVCVSLTAWLSYQRYYLLSTDFCIFFCLFLISFLRGFYGFSQESGPAGSYPLQTLALLLLQKGPQWLRSSENIDGQLPIIMYENLGSGSKSLQKSGFFHIPHTCPLTLWYIIVRNGRKEYGQIKNDIKG